MSNKTISRMQFIRGDFSGSKRYIRPPWSGNEHSFTDSCTHCDKCISICPEHILTKDDKGFPYINFHKGECTFCGECSRACDDGALNKDTDSLAWTLKASIGQKCLPLNGVVCGRCAEECELSAISMQYVIGGIAIPRLESELCNGCGACFRVCPTTAIELSYNGANT